MEFGEPAIGVIFPGGKRDSGSWSGDIGSFSLGADTRLGENSWGGIALTWSKGNVDYSGIGRNPSTSGNYTSRMTSVTPYFGWKTSRDIELWLSISHGSGTITIDDEFIETVSSRQTQMSVAGGVSIPAYASNTLIKGGTTTLQFSSDAWLARGEIKENEFLDGQVTNTKRLRFELEGGHSIRLRSGVELTSTLEVAVRHDGGDGVTGTGLEFGSTVHYLNPKSGVSLEGRGRTLLAHSGGAEEWGFGGIVRFGQKYRGLGPFFQAGVTVGDSGVDKIKLWEDGVIATSRKNPTAQFDAEVGYGLPWFGGMGVRRNYARVGVGDEGQKTLGLGSQFSLSNSFDLDMEIQHRANGARQKGTQSLGLRGRFSF